jgi:hypothetical protein
MVVPNFAVFRIDQDGMTVMVNGGHQVIAFDGQAPDMVRRFEIGSVLPGFSPVGGGFDTAIVGGSVLVSVQGDWGEWDDLKVEPQPCNDIVWEGNVFQKIACGWKFLFLFHNFSPVEYNEMV